MKDLTPTGNEILETIVMQEVQSSTVVITLESIEKALTLGRIKPKIVRGANFLSLGNKKNGFVNFFATANLLRMKIYSSSTGTKRCVGKFSIKIARNSAYLRRHSQKTNHIFDISANPEFYYTAVKKIGHLGQTRIRVDKLTAVVIKRFLDLHGIHALVNTKSTNPLLETIFKGCYPVLRNLDLTFSGYQTARDIPFIPKCLKRNIREVPEIKKLTKRFFGVKSRPLIKEMIRILSRIDCRTIMYAQLGRKYLNHDDFTRLLSGKDLTSWPHLIEDKKQFARLLLSKYPQKIAKRLIIQIFEKDYCSERRYTASYMGLAIDAGQQFF
jgi:hypothetical protein